MSNSESDVIDLTDSFTLDDHCTFVIEIHQTKANKSKSKTKGALQPQKKTSKKIKNTTSSGLGDCPVCWDELGTNPLASTKCGHVFCLKCLEHCLNQKRICPTCRSTLKGASAYHPLYLSLH